MSQRLFWMDFREMWYRFGTNTHMPLRMNCKSFPTLSSGQIWICPVLCKANGIISLSCTLCFFAKLANVVMSKQQNKKGEWGKHYLLLARLLVMCIFRSICFSSFPLQLQKKKDDILSMLQEVWQKTSPAFILLKCICLFYMLWKHTNVHKHWFDPWRLNLANWPSGPCVCVGDLLVLFTFECSWILSYNHESPPKPLFRM